MDTDIEKLHILLLDTKLPSTIHELRNPTEEFVINLIVTFLKLFKIDVNSINKPTFEQQAAMTYLEDNDIIGIINLYVVMRQICDQIFLPEFYISDITSSGSKKVRKFASYLANFMLYATNKESDLEDIINDIHSKGRLLKELEEKKRETLTLKNEEAIIIYKQSSLKEKLNIDIENLRSLMESNEKRQMELGEEIITMEKKRQKLIEDFNTYRLEVQTCDKAIADLKSEVVNSPEKYQSRLYKLQEQQKSNIESREQMLETFRAKDQLVKKYSNISSFIDKRYKIFFEVMDIYENLKKVNIQAESSKEQVDTMINNISELIKKREMLANNQGTTIDEIHARTEEKEKLRELHTKLLSEMKLGTVKIEKDKVSCNESFLEKNKIQSLIKKIEEETSTYIRNCQERYDKEVFNEINLQKCFKSACEGLNNTTI